MAVFTPVTIQEAQALLDQLHLGQALQLTGIEGGIENTNYFLDCAPVGSHEDEPSRYVLTLFERLSKEELPFYLHLMKHLANKGIPVPDPQVNDQGELLFEWQANRPHWSIDFKAKATSSPAPLTAQRWDKCSPKCTLQAETLSSSSPT